MTRVKPGCQYGFFPLWLSLVRFLVMGYRGGSFCWVRAFWTTGTLALGRLQGLWHFHFGQRKEALGGSPAGLGWCGFPADPTEILMA